MMRIVGLVSVCFFAPLLVWGASVMSDEFTARVFVGTDVLPPLVPSIVSVEPVSPYQIDIDWLPTTDDVFVAGYRVYRDAVVIATTTQTSFNDIGLTPSTTYTYTIDAFDFMFNASSSSAPIATTTLPLPPVPVTPTTTTTTITTTSATAAPVLRTISVTPDINSALVSIDSVGPTRYIVKWGRTTSYELGSMMSGVMRRGHSMVIEDLEPGTKYYYEITLINAFGVERVVETDVFVTSTKVPPLALLNVTEAAIKVQNDSAMLRWQAPSVPYQSIRVVRSHLFYPLSVQDGVVVYEGTGDSFDDVDVLAERSPYYYTIFVLYENGQVSSGVTLQARRVDIDTQPDTTSVVIPSYISTSSTDIERGDIRILRAEDVFIEYNGYQATMAESVRLATNQQLRIFIPKSAVAPHLKAILVSVTNPTNHRDVVVYLMRLSPDGTRYETEFVTASVAGEGLILLEVYDYTEATIRSIGRRVHYHHTENQTTHMPLADSVLIPATLTTSILFGTVLYLSWLAWRRREDNR